MPHLYHPVALESNFVVNLHPTKREFCRKTQRLGFSRVPQLKPHILSHFMWPLVVFYFIASVMKLSWLWTAVGLAATMGVTLWLKSKLYLPQQNMVCRDARRVGFVSISIFVFILGFFFFFFFFFLTNESEPVGYDARGYRK
jgi:hypothetical protein